jgi:threonine dehydrogenase-like Zn-dependent dehydrogenase
MGSAINRGLTFRMAQTPVQRYLPKLLGRVEKGEIDPSFVITRLISLPASELTLLPHQLDHGAQPREPRRGTVQTLSDH